MTYLIINSEHTDKYTAALTWMIMFRISAYFIHNMFQNIMAMAKVGGPVAYDVIYSKVVAKKAPQKPISSQNRNSIIMIKFSNWSYISNKAFRKRNMSFSHHFNQNIIKIDEWTHEQLWSNTKRQHAISLPSTGFLGQK